MTPPSRVSLAWRPERELQCASQVGITNSQPSWATSNDLYPQNQKFHLDDVDGLISISPVQFEGLTSELDFFFYPGSEAPLK